MFIIIMMIVNPLTIGQVANKTSKIVYVNEFTVYMYLEKK